MFAAELVDRLGLDKAGYETFVTGLGCTDRACIIATIARKMEEHLPRNLHDWLLSMGFTSEQIEVFDDVLRVNFWHFAMVNDEDRNLKFDAAIRRAVGKARASNQGGPVCVMDLGSGSGLLAMMAARAGADTVNAIETSPLLTQVGPSIIGANGFARQVRWINKWSLEVTMEDVGGAPCDVLVSETLGVSVLDEAGLLYMADLRDRLLKRQPQPQPPLIIPARVRYFMSHLITQDEESL